jgi:hypothetical protein
MEKRVKCTSFEGFDIQINEDNRRRIDRLVETFQQLNKYPRSFIIENKEESRFKVFINLKY